MFHLYTANDAAKLADELGKRLRAQARGNPLVPAQVLVPQMGLRRWLQVHLAESLGVLANVEFLEPARFAWQLLRAAQPELPSRSPFDPEVLRWHLHALLGERLDGDALAPLRDYLGRDVDPLRRFALARELAQGYERLQGYRREKLLRWERGVESSGSPTEKWQAELWRRLVRRVGGASRASRVEAWLRSFDPAWPDVASFVEKPAPPGLPAHLHAFACANISPDVLRMLGVAARRCELDFHLPLPSREYLGDTPQTRKAVRERLRDKDGGNPLIASLGGAAAEFVELLYGYEHVQPNEEIDLFDKCINRDTLLGRVRDDLLEHRAPAVDARESRPALPDASLQFHACHTPLREVQTLHDRLLAMFEDERFVPPLQPREVAVMMPDVAAYRPAIEAVFGGVAHDDARFIPYNVGDVAAAAHPAAQLFLSLLDAPSSRWELDEILGVLAVPGVMRRLDLDAQGVEQMARQLREAGVRWGDDERARAECGGYREFSFAFGIDRLLAGFACGDEDDALVSGIAPLAGVESAAFARLDALLAVLETWRRASELASREMSAAAWQREWNALFDRLYAADHDDLAETRALERVRAALARLVEDSEAAHVAAPLPWSDVRAFLREQLEQADARQQLFAGGVTFCGMVPLRVVPFRVVCLLGMDEAAFPRRDPNGLDPLLADRRAGNAERGDRNVREDDRLLFLQLLAAARDAFYVSWVGRDARSNKPLPPSIVVAELIDTLREGYLSPPSDDAAAKARDAMLPQGQPLHPFDAELFDPAKPLRQSYRGEWLPAARAPLRQATTLAPFVRGELPAPEMPSGELSLDMLKRFYDNPARGYLEQALALRLPHDPDVDADLEPLQPDHPLLRHRLATQLLRHGDGDAARERAVFNARGELPPGELAEVALALARERADALREAGTAFTHGDASLPDVAGTLELDDGTRLAGSVGIVYPAGLLRADPGGSLAGKRVMRAWIDTLFAAALANRKEPFVCRLLWLKEEGVDSRELVVADAEDARTRLALLVARWREGLRSPLPLFANASWRALNRLRKTKGEATREEFLKALCGEAGRLDEDDADFGGPSDFDDDAVRMVWRGRNLSAPDEALATALHATASALFPVPRAIVAKAAP